MLRKEDRAHALRMLVLGFLFQTKQPQNFATIVNTLWNKYGKEFYTLKSEKEKKSFTTRVHNALQSLKVNKLVAKDEGSHKNVKYYITDREEAAWRTAAYESGFTLVEKPKSFKIPVKMETKTFNALVQMLSRILLRIVVELRPYEESRFPGRPIIIGFEEPGNVLRDKLLIIGPDKYSASKIKEFSAEEYNALIRFLNKAWHVYFKEPAHRYVHHDIVLIKFPSDVLEKLKNIVETSEVKSIDEVVDLAVLNHIRGPSKKQFVIDTDSQIIRTAVEKGIYENKREFVEAAINEHEKRLAKELRQTIE